MNRRSFFKRSAALSIVAAAATVLPKSPPKPARAEAVPAGELYLSPVVGTVPQVREWYPDYDTEFIKSGTGAAWFGNGQGPVGIVLPEGAQLHTETNPPYMTVNIELTRADVTPDFEKHLAAFRENYDNWFFNRG